MKNPRPLHPTGAFWLRRSIGSLVCACLLLGSAVETSAQAAAERKAFDIAAGAAAETLKQFAAQSGAEDRLLYSTAAVEGVATRAVRGRHTAQEALEVMLADTGLVAVRDARSGAISIRRETSAEKNGPRAAPTESVRPGRNDEPAEGKPLELPTFEVMGSKLLNMDLPRSRDDIQPYVVLDSRTIEQSGATDLNEFLRVRLTSGASLGSAAQRGNFLGNVSGVNLRGLGQNQTLILIDGRRVAPSSGGGFSVGQFDLNTIPLSAIERVEVLPATASAIYGGSATGGVVNVVLKRNYTGGEVKLTYENTFDTDTALRRIDFSAGLSLGGGKTSVMVSGSWSDRNMLLYQDRDLTRRGRSQLLANNPAALQPGSLVVFGAAINIRSATGTNLVLKSGTPLNASFTSAPFGYAGPASDGGAALVANAGRYNLGLSESATTQRGGQAPLVAHSEVTALSASIRHEVTPRVQVFAEASSSENLGWRPSSPVVLFNIPATAPTNPFQQTIQVWSPTAQLNGFRASESTSERYSAGLVLKLPAKWMAAADFTFSAAQASGNSGPGLSPVITAAINNGTLDILRDLGAFPRDLSAYTTANETVQSPVKSVTRNPALRLGGPLRIPGLASAAQISLKLERIDTTYGSGNQISYVATIPGGVIETSFPRREQSIDSGYAEVALPLVTEDRRLPWLRSVDLQASVRWDRYETLSANNVSYFPPALPATPVFSRNRIDDLNPLFGLRIKPANDVAFRVSYGTGFLPPEFNQLTPAPVFVGDTTAFVDPRRGNTGPAIVPYRSISGGNPNLQPETSRTLTAGIVLTPQAVPGLRLSLDYVDLQKENEITALTRQQILDNENVFLDRVKRGSNLPSDPAGWAGPVTELDISQVNATSARLRAYDLQLDYTLPWRAHGEVTLFAVATWQPEFRRRVAPSTPELDGAGIVAGAAVPLKFNANGGATWTSGPWTLGWTWRYLDSYYVANPTLPTSVPTFLSQGNGGRVRSQHYHDVFAKYTPKSDSGRAGRWLSAVELQLGIRNIFDKLPPFDVSNGFSYYSYLGDERGASYYLSLRRRF